MFYDRKLAIFGIAALALTDNERYLLKNTQNIFGIILFCRNIEDKQQIISLIREIRSINPNVNILIDEEGGRVTRLTKIYPDIADSAQKLGKLYQKNSLLGKKAIINCYSLIAHRLAELGINIICAPVADLAHKNTHRIIGDRSFSRDKNIVIECCKIAANTLLKHRITPVLKHLPGHGKATEDSHLELPIITDDLTSLENNDFAIFKELRQYPLAMTAHIIYACLDSEQPITLSKKALAYLRNNLGFQGKIMTDDIKMEALKKYSITEIVQKSLQAGCDYILHCDGNYAEMEQIVEILENS